MKSSTSQILAALHPNLYPSARLAAEELREDLREVLDQIDPTHQIPETVRSALLDAVHSNGLRLLLQFGQSCKRDGG